MLFLIFLVLMLSKSIHHSLSILHTKKVRWSKKRLYQWLDSNNNVPQNIQRALNSFCINFAVHDALLIIVNIKSKKQPHISLWHWCVLLIDVRRCFCSGYVQYSLYWSQACLCLNFLQPLSFTSSAGFTWSLWGHIWLFRICIIKENEKTNLGLIAAWNRSLVVEKLFSIQLQHQSIIQP